jgi:hypothetical protein
VNAAYVAAVALVPDATPTITTGRFAVRATPLRSRIDARAGSARTRLR